MLPAGNDIEKCIGYYVQDENSDQNDRVCTLANDPDCNFLMSYYISGIMELHIFYWATDTKGVDMEILDFIDPSDSEYWE